MCQICEGFSLEDVLALDAATIAEYGFMVRGVDSPDRPDRDRRPWAYTIGLLDAANHPELIIAGPSIETSGLLLGMIGRSVLAGERYEVGDTIDVDRGVARVGGVSEIQYELNTFNSWHELRRGGVLETADLEAVQIVVPSSFFCAFHADVQPLLDDPAARVDVWRPGPNRAERRRRRPRHSA